jgi:hypothetical protein
MAVFLRRKSGPQQVEGMGQPIFRFHLTEICHASSDFAGRGSPTIMMCNWLRFSHQRFWMSLGSAWVLSAKKSHY